MGVEKNISTFPVSGWKIAKSDQLAALILGFQYLSSHTQKPEEAALSRYYIFSKKQVLELSEALRMWASQLPDTPLGAPSFESKH